LKFLAVENFGEGTYMLCYTNANYPNLIVHYSCKNTD